MRGDGGTDRVTDAPPGGFRHLFAVARGWLGHPSLAARWWVLAVATVGGWVAVALWLPTQHGRFEGEENLWPVVITCALVGCAQAFAQFGGDGTVDRRGKKHDALLRWWQVALVIVLHIVVTSVMAASIVPPVTADSRSDAALDVLLLGFFAWALGPLIVLLAVVVFIAEIAFTEGGFTDLQKAYRMPPGLPRARLVSNGIALFGLAVAFVALIVAIPWLGVSGGGRGAAIAAIVILLLQSLHVIPAPPGVWPAVDRIAYLVGIVAALQAVVFALWRKLTGRAADAP